MDTCKEARIEHETLLRTDPAYSLGLQMDDLAMQQEPAWNQDAPQREVHVTYYEDYAWTNRQWDEVNQLKSMVLHLQSKVSQSHEGEKAQYKYYKIV